MTTEALSIETISKSRIKVLKIFPITGIPVIRSAIYLYHSNWFLLLTKRTCYESNEINFHICVFIFLHLIYPAHLSILFLRLLKRINQSIFQADNSYYCIVQTYTYDMRVILFSIFSVSSIGTLGLINYLINAQSYYNQNEEHLHSSLFNIRRGRSLSDKDAPFDTEGTSSHNQNRLVTHADKSNINGRDGEASNLIDFAIIDCCWRGLHLFNEVKNIFGGLLGPEKWQFVGGGRVF